ncbi:transposase [Sporosarcina sp. P16b]|uniref:tyrosine-type recombinase/integrase n=1 Tax=Sporosarcina sp. P16b TaxID=2048261 RepID=UPI000C16A98A|nr:tyrosine-type recombinase/integrase [Sporosarcina sp. P16b]PIC69251.1 transposase [Sporosarcina sp. P16b]
MMEAFQEYLNSSDLSENTIKGYTQSVNGYIKWFDESKAVSFTKLHRENMGEYISYLKTIETVGPKTINTKLSGLVKFNEFLIHDKKQSDLVIEKNDFVKVQQQYASLAKVEFQDAEMFRQLVLDSGKARNYAIVTVLAYGGLRISETLNLKTTDINLVSREILIVDGKGDKSRTVFMGEKVKIALQSWLRERKEKGIDCEFLFPSNRNRRLDRTVVNRLFNTYSAKIGKDITPHDLRHFFCSNAIEKGMSIHEVANQAGHSNIHTTMLYTNPTKKEMLEKMNRL